MGCISKRRVTNLLDTIPILMCALTEVFLIVNRVIVSSLHTF